MRMGVAAIATGSLLLGTGAGPVAASEQVTPAATGGSAVGTTAPRAAPAADSDRVVVAGQPIPRTSLGKAGTGPGLVAELAATRTAPFGMVGVTWDPAGTPPDLHVEVRVHTATGWSGWEHLDYVAGEGPTAAEDADVRAGTAPLWVGEADGVAVRVESGDGTAPSRLRLVTVQDAHAGTDRAGARSVAQRHPNSGSAIGRPPRFPGLPRVIDRSRWKANPAMTSPCSSPRFGNTAKAVFVHHTAGSSKYSVRESPAIVRSVYAYHTQAQDWCDIGYNALIDRFGNIFAGRRGGIRKPVRGAHAGEVNTNSVGVSLMGNFMHKGPSKPMVNALVRFTGWRLATSYAPVRGKTRVAGERYRRISGHRDAMSTACPGDRVYERLPRIRKRVAHYVSRYGSKARRKADRLRTRRTGQVFVGEDWRFGGTRTQFGKGAMFHNPGYGAHFLRGRVLHRFTGVRGLRGPLGWPRSDVQPSRVPRVRFVVFKGGRMYVPRHRPVRVLYGPVLDRYRKTGFATGRLGLPVSNVRKVRGGHRVRFRHGTIRWDRSRDTTTVVLG